MEIDPELYVLLDALDDVIAAEARARNGLMWEEATSRVRPSWFYPSEVYAHLWSRHRPEKNLYGLRNGRRVVLRHVFVQRNASEHCVDWCPYCMNDAVVCRQHEFELRGREAIRRYVHQVVWYSRWMDE